VKEVAQIRQLRRAVADPAGKEEFKLVLTSIPGGEASRQIVDLKHNNDVVGDLVFIHIMSIVIV
jgi:hypothetical protein